MSKKFATDSIIIWTIECVTIGTTDLPTKSDSDVIFCLQSYQGLMIDILLVY